MTKIPDQSIVRLTSPDVRVDNGSSIDPFWPELALNFPVTPVQMNNWAELIFEASDFLTLFDQEENNNE